MADAPARRDQFNLWVEQQVRWGDMDANGHLNNSTYFTFCESARIQYLERLWVDTNAVSPAEGPAIVHADLNFRQQVHYPARLDIGVRVARIGGKSFTLHYGLFHHGTDDLVADGTSVAVWADFRANKALPLPQRMLDAIRDIDGEIG